MSNKELADLIFPNIDKTIEDYEKMYPERELPDGALVTRFAPSPTGFVHIGNLFQALTDYFLAKNSGGVFYLRNEDTDTKREVTDAVEKIMECLDYVGLNPAYLSRIYKETAGQSINSYISDQRTVLAKKLLKDPTIKIQKIAEMTGMRTAYHLPSLLPLFPAMISAHCAIR